MIILFKKIAKRTATQLALIVFVFVVRQFIFMLIALAAHNRAWLKTKQHFRIVADSPRFVVLIVL